MFRTLEISDSDFEREYLRFITVKTQNLKGRGDICVFVPPVQNRANIPLVILLHGVYGSAWSWAMKGGVHLTALRMIQEKQIRPMVIAMPSDGLWGDGSAYLPHSGFDFEKWIVDDVPNAVYETNDLVGNRSHWFISGLSMGGYGALRIGAKYPQLFQGVSAHSAMTSLAQMPLFVEEPLTDYEVADIEKHDVLKAILHQTRPLPKIRFDCGSEDKLIEYNRQLNNALTQAQIIHDYKEYPGGHEWIYWQEHIKDSLLFFDDIASQL